MSEQPKPAAAPASGGARPVMTPIRAPSGHLIGYLDRARMVLEVKPHAGQPVEEIDLRPYLVTPD